MSLSKGKSDDSVQGKLTALSEEALTKDVLIPLFKSLGYTKVDYNGGPYEIGKDLICWKKDEIGEVELMVCQVKKYQISAKSADVDKNFATIVCQLQQASEQKVKHTDGNEYKPNKVYFVTPYCIGNRALESRFSKYQEIHPNGVKIIEGYKLIELCNVMMSGLLDRVLGLDGYEEYAKAIWNNTDVMSALNSDSCVNLLDIYTDLEISIGDVSSTNLYSEQFAKTGTKRKLTDKDWHAIRDTVRQIQEICCTRILDKTIEDIDLQFIKYDEMKPRLKEAILSFSKTRDNAVLSLKEEIDRLAKYVAKHISMGCSQEIQIDCQCCVSDMEKVIARLATSTDDNPKHKTINPFNSLRKRMVQYRVRDNSYSDVSDCFEKSVQYLDAILDIDIELKEIQAKIASTVVEVLGNPQELKRVVEVIVSEIEAFSKNGDAASANIGVLKAFLEKCYTSLKLLNKIKGLPALSELLSLRSVASNINPNLGRLQIPLYQIFDTELDVALLGEAGAGKTTSLKHYVQSKIAARSKRKYFYVPLSMAYSLSTQLFPSQDVSLSVQKLVQLIAHYLTVLKYPMTQDDLTKQLRTPCTILFDGIDEIAKQWPAIGLVLHDFKQSYTNCQMIVTSRLCNDIMNKLDVLCVTLLPFTDKQQESFVNKWFCDSPAKASDVLAHLNSHLQISIITRNPLLATMICVLSKHSVPLPLTEIEMYEHRANLLFGQYDIHKKIRRLDSHKDLLLRVALVSAFYLHSHSVRELPPGQLLHNARKSLHDRYSDDSIAKAFHELLDPCNILIPMTYDGKVGFGHLRYQEYFAASALQTKWGINIVPLMAQQWWRSALVLFSQMTDNIDFIFDQVKTPLDFIRIRETFFEMLKVRSKSQQKRLLKRFNSDLQRMNEIARRQKYDGYDY